MENKKLFGAHLGHETASSFATLGSLENKQITYIEPGSLGKMVGTIALGLAVLWLIPVELLLIKSVIFRQIHYTSVFLPLLMVLIVSALAYLFGIIAGYLYNFSAKRIGGIEIELS